MANEKKQQTPKKQEKADDSTTQGFEGGDRLIGAGDAPTPPGGSFREINPAYNLQAVRGRVSDIFQIDYTNRLIRPVPGVDLATNTRRFLKLSQDFLLSGVLKADTSVTEVKGTTSETTLNSYTVPLNTISRNYAGAATASGPRDWRDAGNVFRVFAAGVYSTDDAVNVVTLKCTAGATNYHSIASTGATVTNVPWYIDWTFIVTTLGAIDVGKAESFARCRINNVNKDSGNTSDKACNTIADLEVKVTATWTTADSDDKISIRQFIVELLN